MPHDALQAVFIAWQKTNCSPFTWASVLKVLASTDVEHKELADDIVSKLVTCIQTSKWSKIQSTNTKIQICTGLLKSKVFQWIAKPSKH